VLLCFNLHILLNHTVETVSSKFSLLNCAFVGAKFVNQFTTHAMNNSTVKYAHMHLNSAARLVLVTKEHRG